VQRSLKKKRRFAALRRCSAAKKNKRGRLDALERSKKKREEGWLRCSVAKKNEGWLHCSTGKINEEG
jgi:hypothetical protein